MLQQTQVKTVLPYWKRWMRAMPDIRSLATARPETLHKLWEGLGYYTRVRNMQKAAQQLMAKHGGQFPHDFDDVLALPGIGRYTAGAICSIAFNQPKPILDGNVIRVLTRLFGIGGNPREKETNTRLWQLAKELVQTTAGTQTPGRPSPDRQPSRLTPHASRSTLHAPCSHFNQSLMELGALVCTPRQPQCGLCPVARQCVARREQRVDELPELGPRIRATQRRFVAFVAEQRGRFLARQRPAGVVNAHLWEFPNAELEPDESNFQRAAKRVLGAVPVRLRLLSAVKHSITRYRITLEVARVSFAGTAPAPKGAKWLTPDELGRLPFASAHKKILCQLEG
jgi:A/G-specific adenine glycosylase